MLDILLLSHNKLENTKKCVEALYQNTPVLFKLLVIDDSTDETPAYFIPLAKEKGNICYYRPEVEIKSANQAINIGLRMTQSDPFVFLTNSTFVTPNWLSLSLSLMESNPKAGIVGFKIVDPETHRIVDAAGGSVGKIEDSFTVISEVLRVGWAAVVIRREALSPFGLEENYYIGFRGVDDTDNCFDMRHRGWKIIYNGYNRVYHKPSSSNGENKQAMWETNENCRRFLERWKDDPYVMHSGITYDANIKQEVK